MWMRLMTLRFLLNLITRYFRERGLANLNIGYFIVAQSRNVAAGLRARCNVEYELTDQCQ